MFGKNEIVGKKYFAEARTDQLFVTSAFMTLQGEGPYRGQPAFFIRLAKCNLACFGWLKNSGRQPNIAMTSGNNKKLGEIQVGDKLLTLNEEGNLVETTAVGVVRQFVDKWVRVRIEGTIYYVTPEHPFFTNRGMVNAEDLVVGDEILHTTANDMRSYKRKRNNPMHNEESVRKRLLNIDYNDVGQKVAAAIKRKKDEGTCHIPGGGGWSLEVHHKDHDRSNDVRENLEVLCHSIDHQKWLNFPWAKDAHNGKRVEMVQVVDRLAKPPSLRGNPLEVVTLECAPYPTYLADTLWSHNCSFCDTFFDDGDWLTFDEIFERIETTIDKFYADKGIERPSWTRHYHAGEFGDPIPKKMVLVITGGEPMLQNNLDQFLGQAAWIFENTQIESNGTQNTHIPDNTTLVISPKCLEVRGKAVRYLEPRPEILERADCLKFVMEADPDSPYSTIPEWAHKWRRETGREVFVSPMNIYNSEPKKSKQLRATTNHIEIEERSTVDEVISFWEEGLLDMKANQQNHEYSAQYCVTHGFTLNLQIHLYASLA